MPIPSTANSTSKAIVTAAAAETSRVPRSMSATKCPVSAPSTWSTMSAPPTPDSTEYGTSEASRMTARRTSAGRDEQGVGAACRVHDERGAGGATHDLAPGGSGRVDDLGIQRARGDRVELPGHLP